MLITNEMIEAAARAMYEDDPIVEGGECVDGFQVSPNCEMTWSDIVEVRETVAEAYRKQARIALAAADRVSCQA